MAELDLKKDTETFLDTTITLDEVLEKFQYNPSIKRIRETFHNSEKFSFTEVTEDQVRKEILHLDGSKATPVGDILVVILNLTVDVHLSTITKVIHLSLRNGCPLNDLNSAEISPILKKDIDLEKENYRPVSVLCNVSKVFERIIYTQINNFMENKLAALLTGSGKTTILNIVC